MPESTQPGPLRAVAVMLAAIAMVTEQINTLACVLAVPVSVLAVVELLVANSASGFGPPVLAVVAALSMACFVLYAVPCHRVIYFGNAGVPKSYVQPWTLREWKFLGYGILLGIAYYAIIFLAASTWLVILERPIGLPWNFLGFFMLAAYPISRLSLVLPALAVDDPISLAQAWRMSRGNGWRLVALTMVFPVAIGVLPELLSEMNAAPVAALGVIASYALYTVGIACLTLSYSELRRDSSSDS